MQTHFLGFHHMHIVSEILLSLLIQTDEMFILQIIMHM